MTIRPHAYVRDDRLAAREWSGARRCAVCEMPKQHKAHDVNDDAGETAALRDRILGERELEDGT